MSGSDREQLEEVQATPTPERHPEYWNLVYRLVMRGQLSEASSLLMHHSRAHANPTVCPTCVTCDDM